MPQKSACMAEISTNVTGVRVTFYVHFVYIVISGEGPGDLFKRTCTSVVGAPCFGNSKRCGIDVVRRSYDSSPTYADRTTSIPHRLLFTTLLLLWRTYN